jgi:hypothetical protein
MMPYEYNLYRPRHTVLFFHLVHADIRNIDDMLFLSDIYLVDLETFTAQPCHIYVDRQARLADIVVAILAVFPTEASRDPSDYRLLKVRYFSGDVSLRAALVILGPLLVFAFVSPSVCWVQTFTHVLLWRSCR